MTAHRIFWGHIRARWSLLVQTLQTWPWRETLATLRLRFSEDRLGLTAGSLTFTTTIALVPLFTVMLALFSAFPMFSSFRKVLETQVIKGLVPDAIASQVILSLTKFAGKASQLGGLGMIVLGITAMALMLTIDRTLNGIWRVKTVRPFTQRVLVYWAALTLGPLLLAVSLTVTSYALSASKGLVSELPGGVELLLELILFVLQTAGFAALYRFVPNTFVKWEHAWGGAVFASVCLEIAQEALALYLSSVPVYATIYGAFAALPIFLIWIYVSWLILLAGAVVVAYTPSLLSQVKRWPDTPGHRFALSVALLNELWKVRQTARRGLSAEVLAQRLRTDPLQIEPVLECLQKLDWIGLLNEAGDDHGGRFVMLCEPAATRAGPLIAEMLVKPDAWTLKLWSAAGLETMSLQEVLTAPPAKV